MIYIKDIEDLIINILLKVEDNTLDFEDDITMLYISTLNSIKRVVNDMYNTWGNIIDKQQVLTYTDLKKRLTNSEMKQIKSIIKQWLDEVDDDYYYSQLSNVLDRNRLSRLDYFDLSLNHFLQVLFEKKTKKLDTELVVTYLDSYYTSYYLLGKLNSGLVPEPSASDVDKKVRTSYDNLSYKSAYKSDKENTYREISKLFQQCIAARRSSKYVMETIEKSLAKSNNRSRVRCRTEANNKFNLALKNVFLDLNIRKYKYCAILDDRTSEICRNLNGKEFKVSEARVGINYPPMHPNCRSSVIPTGNMFEFDKGIEMPEWSKYIKKYYSKCRLPNPIDENLDKS